ncbi:uncharacterized protein [Watersipora subatra]|uniref:uncharacterized protein n=1 Tax=Watersipora subatra TaxID=2589382 RepID=UPI00355B1AAE
MKVAVIILLSLAMVSAIDLRMCQRNCRKNDHFCRWTGAPGQMGNFCMQKYNECQVGCIQNCKSSCANAYTSGSCVTECQYRGTMMIEMNMEFDGRTCIDDCQQQANNCNRVCDDAFNRLFLHRPLMQYIYPEMKAEDWTVRTGLMDNPHREVGYQPQPQPLPGAYNRRA